MLIRSIKLGILILAPVLAVSCKTTKRTDLGSNLNALDTFAGWHNGEHTYRHVCRSKAVGNNRRDVQDLMSKDPILAGFFEASPEDPSILKHIQGASDPQNKERSKPLIGLSLKSTAGAVPAGVPDSLVMSISSWPKEVQDYMLKSGVKIYLYNPNVPEEVSELHEMCQGKHDWCYNKANGAIPLFHFKAEDAILESYVTRVLADWTAAELDSDPEVQEKKIAVAKIYLDELVAHQGKGITLADGTETNVGGKKGEFEQVGILEFFAAQGFLPEWAVVYDNEKRNMEIDKLVTDFHMSSEDAKNIIKLDTGLSGEELDEAVKQRREVVDAEMTRMLAFANKVHAEYIDSALCSIESEANLTAIFPKTTEYFQNNGTDVAQVIEEVYKTVDKEENLSPENSLSATLPRTASSTDGEEGFGLRWRRGGGWFPGKFLLRGAARIVSLPVRAGVRYAQWRRNGNGLFNFRRAARGGGFVANWDGGNYSRPLSGRIFHNPYQSFWDNGRVWPSYRGCNSGSCRSRVYWGNSCRSGRCGRVMYGNWNGCRTGNCRYYRNCRSGLCGVTYGMYGNVGWRSGFPQYRWWNGNTVHYANQNRILGFPGGQSMMFPMGSFQSASLAGMAGISGGLRYVPNTSLGSVDLVSPLGDRWIGTDHSMRFLFDIRNEFRGQCMVAGSQFPVPCGAIGPAQMSPRLMNHHYNLSNHSGMGLMAKGYRAPDGSVWIGVGNFIVGYRYLGMEPLGICATRTTGVWQEFQCGPTGGMSSIYNQFPGTAGLANNMGLWMGTGGIGSTNMAMLQSVQNRLNILGGGMGMLGGGLNAGLLGNGMLNNGMLNNGLLNNGLLNNGLLNNGLLNNGIYSGGIYGNGLLQSQMGQAQELSSLRRILGNINTQLGVRIK